MITFIGSVAKKQSTIDFAGDHPPHDHIRGHIRELNVPYATKYLKISRSSTKAHLSLGEADRTACPRKLANVSVVSHLFTYLQT